MKKFIAPILTGLMLVGAASAAVKIGPKPHSKHTPPRHIICPLGSHSSGCSSNGHILSGK
jgi:hypothetical protein